MMSRHFRLRSELSASILKRLQHAENQLSVPGNFFLICLHHELMCIFLAIAQEKGNLKYLTNYSEAEAVNKFHKVSDKLSIKPGQKLCHNNQQLGIR